MSRILKRILLGGSAVLALLIIALAVAPYLFKDRILDAVRTQANDAVNAKIDFKDADLSLLTTFPVFELGIDALTVEGTEEFAGERLADIERIALGVDLWALVFERKINVTRVLLRKPSIRLIVNDAGRANYDIAKKSQTEEPPPPAEESSPIALRVSRYDIEDGTIQYLTPDVRVTVDDLDHSGRASIDGSTQVLASTTDAASITAIVGDTAFLKKVKLRFEVDSTVDGAKSAVDIRTANLTLNALSLLTSGAVAWGGPALELDLNAKTNDDASLKGLLSLIPNAYTKDFGKVDADGTFSVAARVSGKMTPGGKALPPLSVTLKVNSGRFKYPDRRLDVRDIQLDASVKHPGGPLDAATIDVPTFALRVGESFVSARVKASKVETAPTIDLAVDSRIALADVKAALPPEQAPDVSGLIEAKMQVAGPASAPQRIEGTLSANDLVVGGSPAQIQTAKIALTTDKTTIEEVTIASKNSDLRLSGTLSPVTALMTGDAKMKGRLALSSKQLIVDDFITPQSAPAQEGDDAKPTTEAAGEAQEGSAILIPDNIDAKVSVDIDRLKFGKLELRKMTGQARVKDREAVLDGIKANGLGGRLSVKGKVVTSPTKPAEVELGYSIAEAGYRDTYEAVGVLDTVAPIIRHLTGRFGSDLSLKAKLGPDGSLVLDSLNADGFVATTKSKIDGFKPLQALASALPMIKNPLSVGSAKAVFKIKDGAVTVEEFPVRAAGLTLQISGKHQLDQNMRYSVATKVPINKLGSRIAGKAKGLGVDLGSVAQAKVAAVITGTVDDPKLDFDVSLDEAGKAVVKAAKKVVKEKVKEVAKKASEEAKKLVAQARAKAKQLMAEADKAAKKVEREADQQAKKLEAEAKGNPFKRIAAQQGAKLVRKKGRDAAKKLIDEADAKAQKLIADAEAKAKTLE